MAKSKLVFLDVVLLSTLVGMIATTATCIMKSTKVQTLGGIWWKCWNISIENTFACIRIIVLGIYRTSFQHNLHCFINACVHVVND